MRTTRAFTLIELLVVVSIIALLIAILLPTLGQARRAAVTVKCLTNVRSLQIAQELYANDRRGELVDAGLPHGGVGNEAGSWINTLQEYHETPLLRRSPADRSVHWPVESGGQGVPVPPTTNVYRRTSYGINNYLTSYAPFTAWRNRNVIPRPASTVQFLMMTETGEYAGSDHPHVEGWWIRGINPEFIPAPRVPQRADRQARRADAVVREQGQLGLPRRPRRHAAVRRCVHRPRQQQVRPRAGVLTREFASRAADALRKPSTRRAVSRVGSTRFRVQAAPGGRTSRNGMHTGLSSEGEITMKKILATAAFASLVLPASVALASPEEDVNFRVNARRAHHHRRARRREVRP